MSSGVSRRYAHFTILKDHNEADYFQTNDDHSLSILVDAQDLQDVLHSFARHNIDVADQQDAIFGDYGSVHYVDVTLTAKQEDILFALDSSKKFIRPFPKGYSRVR